MFICMHVCVCVHVCVHAYMHACIHTNTHTCQMQNEPEMHTRIQRECVLFIGTQCSNLYTSVDTYIYTHTYIRTHAEYDRD